MQSQVRKECGLVKTNLKETIIWEKASRTREVSTFLIFGAKSLRSNCLFLLEHNTPCMFLTRGKPKTCPLGAVITITNIY